MNPRVLSMSNFFLSGSVWVQFQISKMLFIFLLTKVPTRKIYQSYIPKIIKKLGGKILNGALIFSVFSIHPKTCSACGGPNIYWDTWETSSSMIEKANFPLLHIFFLIIFQVYQIWRSFLENILQNSQPYFK
jgi:hypothetical protein